MSVLAIDAGTTGVTALVIAPGGTVAARGYTELPQHYPRPGWVEHDPEEIWQATVAASRAALAGADASSSSGRTDDPGPVTCVGITNQRETVVIWDRADLAAPRPAIVWQDRRTARICDTLRAAGHEERVTELTGLRLDPYFTGTKLTWLAEQEPAVLAGLADGSLAAGTVDSYLIARLTGGRRHVTDASNASRTLLFDIGAGRWSAELCELLRVPQRALPEVVPSTGVAGRTDPGSFLGLDLPIAGIAGDQQAALFGQACLAPGDIKCTYGTGSFVLANTGPAIVRSAAGLVSTVAWMDGSGALTYALEGSVFVTGAAVQWLRDGLGLLDSAAQSEELAASVPDSGGVVFVPALTGLGAPDWDPHARGAMFGLTRGTTRAHLVRATLEAIAFEVRDVFDAMVSEQADGSRVLRVDGGGSANGLLMQLQADQLQVPVERPEVGETTALGAAFLAGLGTGVWSSPAQVAATWRLDQRFEPGTRDDQAHARWRRAVGRAKGWADDGT
ncbi:MAG TPA: glycerol kinase GlpK [Streptosporangiaceae bacterium]|nr:glycerol kinase GlpK [Streptosporangiaceae bacterium]